MINRVTFAKSMDSISNYREALEFKKEALDIPLELFSILVPEEIGGKIPDQTFGVGIYMMDRIKPECLIGSTDKFFKKTPEGFEQITPQPGMDPKEVYYSSNRDDIKNSARPLNTLANYFGTYVSLRRSNEACRRILGIQAFHGYMESLGLFEFYRDIRIPTVHQVLPELCFESWREYKIRAIEERVAKARLENPSAVSVSALPVSVEEQDYEYELLNLLGPKTSELVKTFSDFFEHDRDCFYRTQIHHNHLRLIKGIDHKFLPYYERKFGTGS